MIKLHIRKIDQGKKREPDPFYLIDLSSTIEDSVLVSTRAHESLRVSLTDLMLATRPAHPYEYADTLERFLRFTQPISVELVDADQKPEDESRYVHQWLDRKVTGEELIRKLRGEHDSG